MSTTTKLKPRKTLEEHQREYQKQHINIILTRENYENLRMLGEVPQTMNDIVGSLLAEKKSLIEAIRAAKSSR
jgi:hypothetical protein